MKRRLTEVQKIRILQNFERKSLALISDLVGAPKSTIWFFLQRWNKYGSITNKKPKGRRQKLIGQRLLRKIRTYFTNNPETTLKEAKVKLKLSCCLKTLSKKVKSLGFGKFLKKNKSYISPTNIRKRLEWCNKYKDWDENMWRKIVWSDETSIEIGKTYRTKIWRLKGTGLQPGNYNATKTKFLIKYIKIWSLFGWEGTGAMHVCTSPFNSSKYRDILASCLKRQGKKVSGIANFTFMHDGDTCHKGEAAKWLQKKKIRVIDWPPQSSDLCPLENLWYFMKKEMSMANPQTQEEVLTEAKRVWKKFSKDFCRSFIRSVPNRIKKVLDNKGLISGY